MTGKDVGNSIMMSNIRPILSPCQKDLFSSSQVHLPPLFTEIQRMPYTADVLTSVSYEENRTIRSP